MNYKFQKLSKLPYIMMQGTNFEILINILFNVKLNIAAKLIKNLQKYNSRIIFQKN